MLQILTTGIGALLGAWAGVHLAATRLRNERAFERRLAWYEQLHRVLDESRSLVWSAVVAEDSLGTKAAIDKWRLFAASLPALHQAGADAELYAPNGSLATIRRALEDVQTFLAGVPGDDATPEDHAGYWKQHGQRLGFALREASVIIAQDVRKHLGLDKLDLRLLRADSVPEARRLKWRTHGAA